MNRRSTPRVHNHGTPGTPCSGCAKPIEPITLSHASGDGSTDVYHGGIGCFACKRQFCRACALKLGLFRDGHQTHQRCTYCAAPPVT